MVLCENRTPKSTTHDTTFHKQPRKNMKHLSKCLVTHLVSKHLGRLPYNVQRVSQCKCFSFKHPLPYRITSIKRPILFNAPSNKRPSFSK